VTITASGEVRVLETTVSIVPDILITERVERVAVKEGEEFRLRCDVLPGVDAKRLWKKNKDLVAFESGGRVHFEDNGGTVVVSRAKLGDQGVWACVASVSWGSDEIEYRVDVRQRAPEESCMRREAPEISAIESRSNTSVLLEWQVSEEFNSSCYSSFVVAWWTNSSQSPWDEQEVGMGMRRAIIEGLNTSTAYYFHIKLTRDARHKVFHEGPTRSHWTILVFPEVPASSSSPKAVIIVVILVMVLLLSLLLLLYVKRAEVTDYLSERRKRKEDLEFSEFRGGMVANPDFMAVLAPQWPEADPDPTEDQAFLQTQRLPSSRRGSKELITSSWSSLFNVASEEAIDEVNSEENYRDSLYRGRYRKE